MFLPVTSEGANNANASKFVLTWIGFVFSRAPPPIQSSSSPSHSQSQSSSSQQHSRHPLSQHSLKQQLCKQQLCKQLQQNLLVLVVVVSLGMINVAFKKFLLKMKNINY